MKVRSKNYVWCDYHGEIHEAKTDFYDVGGEDGAACSKPNWRKVYIESQDKDEEF